MNRTRQLLILALVGLLMAAGGGGGAWWWLQRSGPAGTAQGAAPAAALDKQEYRYVTLDDVIVMLRGNAGEPLSHYMAVDLVFKTAVDKERVVKSHLPLLRAVAVKALSAYPLDKASAITVEQLSADLNAAYKASYLQDRHEMPFSEALVSKLIIE